jgi:uncharacterized protein YjiS (DUF1127 family)
MKMLRYPVPPVEAPLASFVADEPRATARPTLASRFRHAWRRRRTRMLLAQLPDNLLKDIGVTRSEAQMEASKPFWRL